MTFRQLLSCSVAATALVASLAGSANAAVINLVDLGGVTGSPAANDFKIAAAYWGSVLTNNVTINLGVGFAPLPTDVIGSTGSTQQNFTVQDWETDVAATKSGSFIDTHAVLPTLNAQGGATMITNGVAADGNNDTGVKVLNPGTSVASQLLFENTAVVKAVGGAAVYNDATNPLHLDGQVTFSSDFAFDFNPSNGVAANDIDFVATAIHEIGHALGFVSGVDTLDYFGYPKGPGAGVLGYDLNDTSIFSALDMFRYSSPGVLDETVGTDSYFSIDGGRTAYMGGLFSTGAFNGDGWQASHWAQPVGCGPGEGIMKPAICEGVGADVTGLDLAAFDAMGWNLSVNPDGYDMTTAQIFDAFAPVPETSTWTLSILGFGLTGAALRRARGRLPSPLPEAQEPAATRALATPIIHP
jgi:hypothetical protein